MVVLAGILDGSTPALFEAIMAALLTFLAWWVRDMSVHTRGRLELMDAERWGIRADVTRLMAHIEDLDNRLDRLENQSNLPGRRPPH